MTTDSIRLYTYTVIYSDKGLTTPYNLISAEPSGWSPEFADIKRPHVTVDDVGLVFFLALPAQGNIVTTQLMHPGFNGVGVPLPMQREWRIGLGIVSQSPTR